MQTDVQDSFHPTIDEIEALKRLELESLSIGVALHDHIPRRLYEKGYIFKNAEGRLAITEKGLALVKRQ